MLSINEKRVWERLEALGRFSSEKEALTRQTYTPAWEQSVLYIQSLMQSLNMETRIDGCGNLIGACNPAKSRKKPVGIGSHIDTVVNGGMFDGALGICFALELVECLRESGIFPTCPIEVIAFAEEEGGVFGKGCAGSEYVTGNTPLEALSQLVDAQGKSLKDKADSTGLSKKPFGRDYGWGHSYFERFYEVHVEQGAWLQNHGKAVGIVQGVVGILRRDFRFIGQPGHAGATPMDERRDASVALAEFILECYQYGLKNSGDIVVTNGKLTVTPNLQNVIPGTAAAITEIRGPDDAAVTEAIEHLSHRAGRIAARYGLTVEMSRTAFTPALRFDSGLLSELAKAAAGDEAVAPVFSWAGHDSKIMAKVTPAAMLFIPSRDGLSHCPEEYSEIAHLQPCLRLLWQSINREE